MTLNTSEVGVDVHHTTNTELDRNNVDEPKNEEQHHYEFPALRPSRAVLDLATGTLVEILARPAGMTDTVEGRKTEKDEWFDEEYRTKKGQDWGGIIQHHYIECVARQCPEPNAHGEIPVPTTRPGDSDRTTLSPSAFKSQHLVDDDFTSRPLVLLERPEVSYDELIAGDSYNVVGWYDTDASDSDSRIKPVSDIASKFPEIVGVEHTKQAVYDVSVVDAVVPAQPVTSKGYAALSYDGAPDSDADAHADDSMSAYSLQPTASQNRYHVTVGSAFDEFRVLVDSPYEAKDLLSSLPGQSRWSPEQEMWTLDADEHVIEALVDAVVRENDETLTLSSSFISHFSTTRTDVTIHGDITDDVGLGAVLNHAFVEEVVVDSALQLGSLPPVSDGADTDGEFIMFGVDADGNVTASYTDEQPEASITSLADDTITFDCPGEYASYVKQLDWDSSQYEWQNSSGAWIMNAAVAPTLLEHCVRDAATVGIAVPVAQELGDVEPVTEHERVSIDSTAIVAPENTENTVSVASGATDADSHDADSVTRDLHGFTPRNEDALSLTTLDLLLGNTNNDFSGTGHIQFDAGENDIPELRPNTVSQWQTSSSVDADTYSWYHPRTSARVTVTRQTENPESFAATEYAISVKRPSDTETTDVAVVSDERAAVMAAITHMHALTS